MDGIYYIKGKAFYAKILGRPVANYNKDGFEWTLELQPDAASLAELQKLGVGDRINKGEDGDRILFRQREKRRDGTENRPIAVVGRDNKPWPQDKLIGNGSEIELKFNFQDYGKGKRAGMYPIAVRVLEHIPYERQEFPPLKDEDDFHDDPEPDNELNDEVPL